MLEKITGMWYFYLNIEANILHAFLVGRMQFGQNFGRFHAGILRQGLRKAFQSGAELFDRVLFKSGTSLWEKYQYYPCWSLIMLSIDWLIDWLHGLNAKFNSRRHTESTTARVPLQWLQLLAITDCPIENKEQFVIYDTFENKERHWPKRFFFQILSNFSGDEIFFSDLGDCFKVVDAIVDGPLHVHP